MSTRYKKGRLSGQNRQYGGSIGIIATKRYVGIITIPPGIPYQALLRWSRKEGLMNKYRKSAKKGTIQVTRLENVFDMRPCIGL